MKFYKQLEEHGADELLKTIYGPLLTEPESGISDYTYHIIILVELKSRTAIKFMVQSEMVRGSNVPYDLTEDRIKSISVPNFNQIKYNLH